jgi:hypothetical protein
MKRLFKLGWSVNADAVRFVRSKALGESAN